MSLLARIQDQPFVNMKEVGVEMREVLLSACLVGLVLLLLAELQVKLGLRALQILLYKQHHIHNRKIVAITIAQISLLAGLLLTGGVGRDHRAISLYLLAAKLLLIRRELMLVDMGGILAAATFAFLVPTQSQFSTLELMSSLIEEVTLGLFPSLMSMLALCLLPLLLPVILLVTLIIAGRYLIRFLALIRRRYPEDFDLVVLLSISILAYKILRKETKLRQTLIRNIICNVAPQDGNWERLGLEPDFELMCDIPVSHHMARLGESQRGTIVKIDNQTGYFGDVEYLEKPAHQPVFDYYWHLYNNYRMVHVVESIPTKYGCRLTVSHPTRREGVLGGLDKILYQMYVMASWIIPSKYQDYLRVFGFEASTIEVECDCDCQDFNRNILLEKLNST